MHTGGSQIHVLPRYQISWFSAWDGKKINWNSLFLSDEGPMLETLDYTIRIGSTPTFLYFD